MPRKSQQSKIVQVETGDPGTFYFEEPKVIDIASKRKAMQPQNPMRPHVVASDSVTYGEGVCRLKSSHGISGYAPPIGLEYHLSRWPNKLDRDAYLEIMEVQGFNEGSIVCRKHQPLGFMHLPHRWGVILLVHQYSSVSEYKPYLVKWFQNGDVESAWGEDLYLIHQAMEKSLIQDVLESQGCDFPVGKGSPI